MPGLGQMIAQAKDIGLPGRLIVTIVGKNCDTVGAWMSEHAVVVLNK